jgi:hypothetical protein
MVQRPRTSFEAVRLLRDAAGRAGRKKNQSWTVRKITDARGRARGKGSHVMWGVFDADDQELARGSVTNHPGTMSWTVTRNFEADFEELLGEGWMDQ